MQARCRNVGMIFHVRAGRGPAAWSTQMIAKPKIRNAAAMATELTATRPS